MHASKDEKYLRILESLSLAMKAAGERVEGATLNAKENQLDAIVDEECDFIESLLGAAYLVCQTQITTITSRSLQVLDRIEADKRKCKLPAKAYEIHRFQRSPNVIQRLTKVEGLWALANYFKHREEWRGIEWSDSKLNEQTKRTIEKLKIMGLEQRSTGNLRAGAMWLGNEDFYNLDVFHSIIEKWSGDIMAELTEVA